MMEKSDVSAILAGVQKVVRTYVEATVLTRVKNLESNKAEAATVRALQEVIAEQQVKILALESRLAALEGPAPSIPKRSGQRSRVVYLPR